MTDRPAYAHRVAPVPTGGVQSARPSRQRRATNLRRTFGATWGGTGAARRCRRAVLSTFVLIATTVQSYAVAQTASDGLVCVTSEISNAERREFFATVSWRADSKAVPTALESAFFLGNVDGDSPETWTATYNWAKELSASGTNPDFAFSWDNSTVLFGRNSANQEYCILVSDVSLLDELRRQLPDAPVHQIGPKRFLHYEKSALRISASELPAESLAAQPNHKNPAVFTATLVNRQNTGTEANQ